MGVFEMIVAIVTITTIGKVVMAYQDRLAHKGTSRPEEIATLQEAVSEMSTRVSKLEEERDFYRALLEAPDRGSVRRLPPDGPETG